MPGWMKWAIALALGFGFIVLGWRLSDSRWFSWLLPTFFVVNCLFLAMALVLHTDKGVEQGGSVLEKFSKPAPKPAVPPAKPQTTPQSSTPQSSTPQSSTPQSSAPTSSAPAPATQQPAQQPPAKSQPAPSQQPKKP